MKLNKIRTDDVLVRGSEGRVLSRRDVDLLRPTSGLDANSVVALCVRDPVDFLRVLFALDGRVGTILLISYALIPDTVHALAEAADCTHLVTDRDDLMDGPLAVPPAAAIMSGEGEKAPATEMRETRWLMTTSGTTGLPKIVPHTLVSLSRSVSRFQVGQAPVWGLLYDPTRFAGLQVVLQALMGGGTLIPVDTTAPLSEQIDMLAEAGCTALSATPTLWRRILMVPGYERLTLRQATLGGEIVDRGTLYAIRAAFPDARVTHIYASTEAGVGFSVTDGKAGFPANYLETAPGGVRLREEEGILWVRPPVGVLAAGMMPGIEVDKDGFVRTGDRVNLEGDRVFFLGRDNGTINIGGVKIHPERVEAVIGSVPGVVLAQVSSKGSPVTGALVVAEVQVQPDVDRAATKRAIIEACREGLEREAVPAAVRFVDGFVTSAAGKLVRTRKESV